MNQTIFHFFNDFALQNELVDTLIIFIADWLIWWMLFAIVALIFLKKISWKFGFYALAMAVFAWALTEFFQLFYFTPRPFIALDNVNLLFTRGANDSFPSGTTTFAFALATAVYFYNKKIGVFLFATATLIGLSRIIVGIHWPIDILAGGILGIGIALIIHKFLFKKLDFFN